MPSLWKKLFIISAVLLVISLILDGNVWHRLTAIESQLAETTDQWNPFTSTQRVVARRPGFLWDGRLAMLPGLYVHVHDAYIAGEGILYPTIAGVVTLIDLRGGGDVAQGELMRFFTEAAWYPTALLHRQGIHWEAVDEGRARATLTDGPILWRFRVSHG